MYSNVVGVSILTNGNRLEYLKRCISSLLANCYYRPLRIAIFNNGSTDGTKEWISTLRDSYGIEYRVINLDNDVGCAAGTNAACEMVEDCEFALHLESDFELLPEEDTGEDKLWLRRAVEFMQKNAVDFVYLRRMVDEKEMLMHWWAQWMPQIDKQDGNYLHCPYFWWSNNPHLHRTETMYKRGTLPLNEGLDGTKGTPQWSQPELRAAQPGETWIHKWGLFVHEVPNQDFTHGRKGCVAMNYEKCKYGFFKDGGGPFCNECDTLKGFDDMESHADRFVNSSSFAKKREAPKSKKKTVFFHLNQLTNRGTDMATFDFAQYNEQILGNRSVILVPAARPRPNMAFFKKFQVMMYKDWNEAEKLVQDNGPVLLHMAEEGYKRDKVSKNVRTAIHVAFPIVEEYGDVYAYISEWMANHCTQGRLPWVPYVVKPHVQTDDMRKELSLGDGVVYGCYGGPDAFDNPMAIEAVKTMAKERDDLRFLFMNIPVFCDIPKNVIFLEGTSDAVRKARFVNTCDAMLHGRKRGETFGLAVAEFAAAGRPIITWDGSPERAHLEILGDKAFRYSDKESLCKILREMKSSVGTEWDVYTERFAPEVVMEKFRNVFMR